MPAPTDLKLIAALGEFDAESGLPRWAAGDLEVVSAAGRAAIRLYNDRADLETQIEKISSNPELTEAGRRSRIAQLAENFVTVDVRTAKARRDAFADAVERARTAAMRLPEPTGDPIVNELRAQEIRRSIAGGTQLEISEAARAAAAGGNIEMSRAIINAPVALVSQDQAKSLTEAVIRAADPDAFARVEKLESGLRQLDGMIASAAKYAAQLGAEAGPLHDISRNGASENADSAA